MKVFFVVYEGQFHQIKIIVRHLTRKPVKPVKPVKPGKPGSIGFTGLVANPNGYHSGGVCGVIGT